MEESVKFLEQRIQILAGELGVDPRGHRGHRNRSRGDVLDPRVHVHLLHRVRCLEFVVSGLPRTFGGQVWYLSNLPHATTRLKQPRPRSPCISAIDKAMRNNRRGCLTEIACCTSCCWAGRLVHAAPQVFARRFAFRQRDRAMAFWIDVKRIVMKQSE